MKHWPDELRRRGREMLFLRILAGFMSVIALLALSGWHRSLRPVRISLPPQIPYGTQVVSSERSHWEVYTFAGYVWQQYQIWLDDGATDAPQNLSKLQAFFTPKLKSKLRTEFLEKGRLRQMRGRTRTVTPHPDFSASAVTKTPQGWSVSLRHTLEERVKGVPIKTVIASYQIDVIEVELDPETNPWKLAIDKVTAVRVQG